MAGTFGSRFVRSSARAQRSATPPTSRAARRLRWKKICAGAALALIVPMATAQLAFAATDPSGTPTSTTTPSSDTTSTTTPAATDTTSTTTPAATDTTTTTPASDTTTTTPAPVAPATPAGPTVTLLVKTKSGLAATAQADVVASHGGTEVDAVSALRLHIVTVPAADAMTALAAYEADPNVAEVSLDSTRAAGSVTQSGATDPGYASQWALTQIGWDQVHGEHDPSGSATLAILDTGVDASTPDLAGRVAGGWSAFGTDPGTDANGHGTHVATIAAAKADDGNGIAGVAYKGVNVMPVQVLGADGTGTDADIINGLVYAVDHGADVVLMAFSNPGESPALQDAVNYAWSHGVVVVAAAGNDSSATRELPGRPREGRRRRRDRPGRRRGVVQQHQRRGVRHGARHRHRRVGRVGHHFDLRYLRVGRDRRRLGCAAEGRGLGRVARDDRRPHRAQHRPEHRRRRQRSRQPLPRGRRRLDRRRHPGRRPRRRRPGRRPVRRAVDMCRTRVRHDGPDRSGWHGVERYHLPLPGHQLDVWDLRERLDGVAERRWRRRHLLQQLRRDDRDHVGDDEQRYV